MLSLSDNDQAGVIDSFNAMLRFLDDLLNIHNPYTKQMVGHIYHKEFHLNKSKFY